MKAGAWTRLARLRRSLTGYPVVSASLRAMIMSIATLGLVVSVAHGASRFELGRMQQATSATRAEYVAPVTVSADGYSTFSASIYASAEVMQGISWQAMERQSGVNVVISLATPIVTPTRIMLVARYQGRERSRQYWLQPVSAGSQPKPAEEIQVHRIGQSRPNHVEPEKETQCRELLIQAGSLYANIERLTADCGHHFGIWHPGDSRNLVDWIVETGRLLQNNQGVVGLLDLLKEDYRLLGVVRRDGSDHYIDYYELSGGYSDPVR